jgi:hypothetical protein
MVCLMYAHQVLAAVRTRSGPRLVGPCSELTSLMAPLSTIRPIVAAALLLSAAESACAGDTSSHGITDISSEAQGFAMYALSRGKGVPEGAKAALAKAEAMLQGLRDQGADIAVARERIGLEGETRLCVTFGDRGLAGETLERIRRLASGVDLVNLVEEPCGTAAAPRP